MAKSAEFCRGVSGIRLKGGWTLEVARVKIARILSAWRQAHPRGGGEGPGPTLGPEKHYIFSVSSVKLRDLHL